MKLMLYFLLQIFCFVSFAQKKQYMLVGTYTKGTSAGIYVYQFDAKTGTVLLVDSAKTSNPSYLTVSPDKKFVYTVNEDAEKGNGGKLTAFSFNRLTGKLTQLNQQLSGGDHPCYVSINKTGKWVFAGNYTSGTAAVLPVQKDGSLSPATSIVQHSGSSINKRRQQSAHVHATVLSPDGHWLFVPDLGTDKLMCYSFNEKNGQLTAAKDSAIKLPDGSGPRHFVFHPNGKWAYLLQELSGSITAFEYANGKLKEKQTISALPAGFSQPFTSADIHTSADGKFLYASNRDESNTIAIFKIDAGKGTLDLIGHQSTLGKTPRNFSIDPTGGYLLVANQRSNEIVVFKRNVQTGLLQDSGRRIPLDSPVCIQWID